MVLSERLAKIAEIIPEGARVADIGTDHGFLPIYLAESGRARHVVLCDVNAGPLEKAALNILEYSRGNALAALRKPGSLMPKVTEKKGILSALSGKKTYALQKPEEEWDLRKGDGLAPLSTGEVDVCVIAGMGGRLIRTILTREPEKTASFKLFILQPRTEEGMLRAWLRDMGWGFYRDCLVRENGFLCQIIAVVPPEGAGSAKSLAETRSREEKDRMTALCEILDWEVSPLWIADEDPLFSEYLERMIRKREGILEALTRGKTSSSDEKREEVLSQVRAARELLQMVPERRA